MRDLSAGSELLSLNTATVRKQADLLAIVEACARHGIAAISPLRDQVAADRAAVNTLAQVLDIADRLDPGGGALGVAVDVYHLWWDPDLYAGIARAGRERRLLAYHVSDWLVPTKDMLNDRGMMGDGVIEL